MTIEEIKKELMEKYNYTLKQINNIKGKDNLMTELLNAQELFLSFDEAKINNESDINNAKDMVEIAPRFGSNEWTDFVMSKLTEEEKVGGAPKMQALFRVVEEYVGKILESTTRDITFFGDSVVVLHELVFYNRITSENEKFSRVADASQYTTPAPFNKHLSSTAESKAIGRCLRAALRLNVLSAEELLVENNEDQFNDVHMNEPINNGQLMFIDSLCKNNGRGMNISGIALIKSIFPEKPLNRLTREDGIIIQDKLNEYQNDHSLISEEIKGYSEGWQNSIG